MFGLALLAAYAILVPVVGFIIASMAYFLIVVVFSGYELEDGRWWMISGATVGVGVFLFICAQFLQIQLPIGLLGW